KRLLQVIGRDDLVDDARFATPKDRSEREGEVNALVEAWTRTRDKHEAMRLLGAAGIPAGAVLDTKELAEDRSMQERKNLQVMNHPEVNGYLMPAWPVRHNGAPPSVGAAPLLAEHSADVLKSWLGLAPGDIEALAEKKVITRRP